MNKKPIELSAMAQVAICRSTNRQAGLIAKAVIAWLNGYRDKAHELARGIDEVVWCLVEECLPKVVPQGAAKPVADTKQEGK